MRRAPSYSLLGPALLLYLVADAAAAQGHLDLAGAFCVVCAALLSLTWPAALRSVETERAGARRISALGLTIACALPRVAAPAALSLVSETSQLIALCASAALVLDLALTVPDRVGRASSLHLTRIALHTAAGVCAVAAVSAYLPALPLFGRRIIAPAWLAHLPSVLFALALFAAFALRALRSRLGSTPEALASNAWGTLALLPAALAWPAYAALPLLTRYADLVPWLRAALAAVSLWIVFGHLRLIDEGRRLGVGRAMREGAAALLTLAAIAAGWSALAPLWPEGPFSRATAAVALITLAAALYRVLRRFVHTALAPAGGQLLEAIEEGHAALPSARELSDVAAVALRAARKAAGTATAEPFLYLFDPQREYRLDAAGQPHASERPASAEITRALQAQLGELIVRAPLEQKVVREPHKRPLLAALLAADALCVLPIFQFGELEGVLIVPRGDRTSSLTLEELEALRGFGRHVSGFLNVLAGEARAERRASLLLAQSEAHEQALARARAELARTQAELRVLREADAGAYDAGLIAYSESMRIAMRKLKNAAASDAPLLFVAERGLPVAELAQKLHRASGRAPEPFVVRQCTELRVEKTEAALIGGSNDAEAVEAPGWLELAGTGTLLLCDLPALSLEAQRALAATLAGSGNRFRGRLLASCRRDPEALVAEGALIPELRARFASELHVPPLRERTEDLGSLLLLALDRSARRLGRTAPGIEPAAQAQLLAHAWPGNLDELEAVIELAVARCTGPRVAVADLPALGPSAPEKNPLDGTYLRVERRVLQRALERTDGNKSEAARLLGLKRTTFLDKLRRHGLDDGKTRSDAPN